jgi:hypothetical protein
MFAPSAQKKSAQYLTPYIQRRMSSTSSQRSNSILKAMEILMPRVIESYRELYKATDGSLVPLLSGAAFSLLGAHEGVTKPDNTDVISRMFNGVLALPTGALLGFGVGSALISFPKTSFTAGVAGGLYVYSCYVQDLTERKNS